MRRMAPSTRCCVGGFLAKAPNAECQLQPHLPKRAKRAFNRAAGGCMRC